MTKKTAKWAGKAKAWFTQVLNTNCHQRGVHWARALMLIVQYTKRLRKKKEMETKISRKIASIALMAILVVSMSIAFTTQTKGVIVTIPTFLWVQVSPPVVGVGQPIYMQCFMTKPTPTASMNAVGDMYIGITINITAPNGDVTHMGPYTSDPTGGIPSLEFTPTQLGNYTFRANYPGQVLVTNGAYKGDTEAPSVSPIATVEVQQAPIPTIGSPALPTAYWDFPIMATNYGWSVLGGNWLGLMPETFATTGDYDCQGNWNPYSPAPTTAHIMWTKPTQFGGQIGGAIPGDEMHNFMTTTIMSDFFEPIIMQGVLYYGQYNALKTVQTSWNAIDLATGKTLWTRVPGDSIVGSTLTPAVGGQSSAQTLRMGSVFSMHTMQEYGSMALLIATTGSTMCIYDPFSGMYLGNITGMPVGMLGSAVSFLQDTNKDNPDVGTTIGWYVASGNLTMWNMTQCLGGGIGTNQETVRIPATRTWNLGTQWNVTLPTTYQGNTISLSLARSTSTELLLQYAPSWATYDSMGWAVWAGYDSLTGKQLWIENMTEPAENYVQILAANQNVFVLEDKDTLQEWGYSLTNGSKLWGPVQLPGNGLSTLSQAADIAYGRVYTFDLGGYCTAIDLATGKIDWVYTSANAGYNTPYGVYPIWQFGTDSIAGGEIFFSLSRMYDPPMFENATRLALNCSTGQPVWDLLGFTGRACGAVGDGYLVQWNSYDGQIYTIGKGPSAITAAVQSSGTTQGNSVVITGMVTDTSPGTQQDVQKGDFPQGVPCVADSSMSEWMEHVYMQQPMPANVTGVPVVLSVLDSNNNYRQIGTATTDASGFYSFTYTPDISGTYAVYASFQGSQSYYPASTETAFTVAPPAPTLPPTASPVANLVNTSELTMYIAAAIIVMIIALAVATLLILRKKP